MTEHAFLWSLAAATPPRLPPPSPWAIHPVSPWAIHPFSPWAIQLWRQFSLARLNYDISLPLSEAEMRLNGASSPDMSQVRIPYLLCLALVYALILPRPRT